MLCFDRSLAMKVSNCSNLVVSAIRWSLEPQLQRRSLQNRRCVYQMQSRCKSDSGVKWDTNRLSLAVVGATALSVGLEAQMESVTQSRAAIEPVKHKWQLFDQIGSGAFGTVCLGMHEETGEVAAVKIVLLENPDKGRSYPELEREISALKLVKVLGGHSSIIDLRDAYVEGCKMFMITELARGGDLFEQVVTYGSLSETKVQQVSREMASALSFLHRHGLVHKDIKPENVLLSARTVNHNDSSNYRRNKSTSLIKLADFGSAGPAGMVTSLEDIGTAAYLPPELLTSGICTSACDMWALGCVLYIMLCGSHPFDLDGMSPDHVVEHRVKTEPITFAFSAWDNVSPDAKDIICKLLEKDPGLRLTADEMLQHPWVIANAETAAAASLHRPLPLLAGQPIPINFA
ncbi:unnamed protein product [Peronospora destructor]|uniref:Protein kinase domain-containing protein n=1 Tax=Peronospora destructor TaxID=86335 RepID=A0AAV0UH35_9STRA|nr:unnamed protein product [Peronospora destructor]